jgi:glycosyltransferase involved in cell wall biosynthesis
LNPHVLYVGGEDLCLRIPAMLALCKHGFRVSAAGSGDPAPFLRAGLAYRRFSFDRFVNPKADWAMIGALAELLAELRPDIAQSFDTKPSLLLPLAARKARNVLIVRTINGLGWIYSSHSPLALILRPVYRVLHRLAARSTAMTVFQNRDDQAYFERYRMLGQGDARLIPGAGVDIDGFERALTLGAPANELRRQLGVGNAEIVITVARMTRQKGIPTLLKAAKLVHDVRPDVRFLLVGPRESEGPLAVTQEEIDRHAPYVMAVGPRSDVPALLRLADVFAFPTEYREGVPRALLEAALAGLPIVATQMPGCRDVVRDRWSGFLVPPHAPRMLADRVIDLLRDREAARRMGARAQALVRQDFGLDITVARHAAVYAELVRRSAGNGLGARTAGESEHRSAYAERLREHSSV